MITDLNQIDEMKKGVEKAVTMVEHAMPLTYSPTIPTYAETFVNESGHDPALASLSNAEKLSYFNEAVSGLETEEIKLSGVFSSGTNILASISTCSDHLQYVATSDAQVTVVLSHVVLKWEVTAEQSAWRKMDLNPTSLHADLALLLERYQNDSPQQIPLGKYDIVFGSAAIAEMVNFMNWIGFDGGLMKRGFSFLGEEKIGQRVFSEKVTLVDDPARLDTFPLKRDWMGMNRHRFPLFEKGVFQAFTWLQDDADEFSAQPTGHTVPHKSLVMEGGEGAVTTLEELVNMPREKDILYIPFLHYMNIVNPSRLSPPVPVLARCCSKQMAQSLFRTMSA